MKLERNNGISVGYFRTTKIHLVFTNILLNYLCTSCKNMRVIGNSLPGTKKATTEFDLALQDRLIKENGEKISEKGLSLNHLITTNSSLIISLVPQ